MTREARTSFCSFNGTSGFLQFRFLGSRFCSAAGPRWHHRLYTWTKGGLEPGKLADLADLPKDIFTVDDTDLPTTESALTMVGGL